MIKEAAVLNYRLQVPRLCMGAWWDSFLRWKNVLGGRKKIRKKMINNRRNPIFTTTCEVKLCLHNLHICRWVRKLVAGPTTGRSIGPIFFLCRHEIITLGITKIAIFGGRQSGTIMRSDVQFSLKSKVTTMNITRITAVTAVWLSEDGCIESVLLMCIRRISESFKFIGIETNLGIRLGSGLEGPPENRNFHYANDSNLAQKDRTDAWSRTDAWLCGCLISRSHRLAHPLMYVPSQWSHAESIQKFQLLSILDKVKKTQELVGFGKDGFPLSLLLSSYYCLIWFKNIDFMYQYMEVYDQILTQLCFRYWCPIRCFPS